MNMLYYNENFHYKDLDPLSTISKIRDILITELNLSLIEQNWLNPIEGIYSVHLKIPNTNIFSNGKGVTPYLALASAYGEFMERLQNQFLYREVLFDKELWESWDFKFSPDEIYLNNSKKLENYVSEEFLKIFSRNNLDILEKVPIVYCPEVDNKLGVLCIPFIELNTGKTAYLPERLLAYIYGTNGMCAGNTLQEALVQGLSEILERYVNFKILYEEIIPPTIPEKYIKENFSRVYDIILDIEEHGFEVIIKDCSLGGKYPVLAVILISKDKGEYFVKFGAHPVFQIALERCLTEAFQGRTLENFSAFVQFDYNPELCKTSSNVFNIFATGKGFYPPTLFSDKAHYQFDEAVFVNYASNTELLGHLLNRIIKIEKRKIFIRDVSFLGFNSYHIIIPGISEINRDISVEYIYQRERIRRLLRKVKKIQPNSLLEVIAFFQKYRDEENERLSKFIGVPVLNSSPLSQFIILGVLSNIHYKLSNLNQAIRYMESFVKFLEKEKFSYNTLKYFRACRDYLKSLYFKQEDLSFLERIYGREIIQKIREDFKSKEEIFKFYPDCENNCQNCRFSKDCYMEKLKKLHQILREKIQNNLSNKELRCNKIINIRI